MIWIIENDFVKKYRLKGSLKALERVREQISEEAYSRLKELVRYRLYGEEFRRTKLNEEIVVAFSGGSDSTATVLGLRWAGFKVTPVTVKLPQMKEAKIKRLKKFGAVFIEVEDYGQIMLDRVKKRATLCGVCHSLIMESVERYARENGVKIVASGDMLSVGNLSIYPKNDVVMLNFPAFLAMDKGELIDIIGGVYTFHFGCPVLRNAYKSNRSLKLFSIQRVMRELRAGVLTEDMAKELILDILS
ncbi:hypothetical protein PAP_09490 [Palaeococcus pacificus DY20341]|uniref:ATPase n=2 Tax=Palaeococcus TaxID=83867 RepID=A0A075LVB1_9EURY|nr:hypothetical protein PAP_09490 [Palaeococcus pacificus DY20341]